MIRAVIPALALLPSLVYAQQPPDACPAALADAHELITAFVARSADKSATIAGLQAEGTKLKVDADEKGSTILKLNAEIMKLKADADVLRAQHTAPEPAKP